MIIGVGVDIVKIERFENLTPHFMRRVFTEREREYLSGRKAQSIAGIFAAKEAIAKALGTGFVGFSPCDIEILHKQNGAPYAILHNAAKKTAKSTTSNSVPQYTKRSRRFSLKISISHTNTDAIAYAVISQLLKRFTFCSSAPQDPLP